MSYLKPQTPIELGGNYIYPLTTADQVILGNGNRLNSLFKKTIQENITLLASNWSDTLPYTQTITLTESVDDYKVDANVMYNGNENDTALNKAAGCLSYIEKNRKEIIFYCLKNKPEIDIPVEITGTCRNTIATVENGIKLNFDIVAYSSEEEMLADTPLENTIGVITNTPITGYRLNGNEPKNMKNGEVWIAIGVSSAEFEIVDGVPISPIYAKQMISGALVDVTAKSWQNNKWVEWMLYLYREGYDLEPNFVMGSSTTPISVGSGITADGFTWVRTVEKFDFDANKYTKIVAKVYMDKMTYDYPLNLVVSDYTSQNNWINTSENSPPISPVVYAQIRHPATNAENIIECNIEGVTGKHYVGLGLGYHQGVIVREICLKN